MAAYDIDFGSGTNTPTGDTLYTALTKLQARIAAAEAGATPTQDNTLAGNTTLKAGNAAWQSRFQSLETRFTALGAA